MFLFRQYRYAGKVTVTALIFHPRGEGSGTLQQGCTRRCFLRPRSLQYDRGRKHLHFQFCHARGDPQSQCRTIERAHLFEWRFAIEYGHRFALQFWP